MSFAGHSAMVAVAFAAVLAGCGGSDRTAAALSCPVMTKGHAKVGAPYQIKGVWYRPRAEPGYEEVGEASWYGPGFHCKVTANGETFDENLLSAAHRTMPLPSMVEVVNVETGVRIKVRVNDRGPFADDRILDLSRAAARVLGVERRGVARVHVRYLGPAALGALARTPEGDVLPTPGDTPRPSWVLAGAFQERGEALRAASRLASLGEGRVGWNGRRFLTLFGPYAEPLAALRAAQRARVLGFAQAWAVAQRDPLLGGSLEVAR